MNVGVTGNELLCIGKFDLHDLVKSLDLNI